MALVHNFKNLRIELSQFFPDGGFNSIILCHPPIMGITASESTSYFSIMVCAADRLLFARRASLRTV